MQERLSETEAATCRKIAAKIGSAFDFDATHEGREYWQGVVESLCRKWKHGTSDGKPWVEPEPPIPEGYRKAEPDEWKRDDVKFWSSEKNLWASRLHQGLPFDPMQLGRTYIVPIDPLLTDRDACVYPRPLVMVRDNQSGQWEGPFRYVGRYDDDKPFPFIVYREDGLPCVWKEARRATPAEIEAAK